MSWEEFINKWARLDYEINDLLLIESLNDNEIETIISMFPDCIENLDIKDACKKIHIEKRAFSMRCSSIYSKCDLEGTGSKDELNKRLRRAFPIYLEFIKNSSNSPSLDKKNSIYKAAPDINLDDFWRHLLNVGEYTETKIGLIFPSHKPGIRKLIKRNHSNIYPRQVSKNDEILIDIHVDTQGYLILFQRDVSGEIFCLSPSYGMQNNLVKNNKYTIPENDFFTADVLGKTELCAIIVPDMSQFTWLKNMKGNEAIKAQDLLQILDYINLNNTRIVVFYTIFWVTE
jgi:hypothetical protein